MKVVMVETGGWGGIAHYTWNLCQELQEQGADVRLLTNVRYELDRLPSRFVAEPCVDARVGYLRNAWRLYRRFMSLTPDVVHVQSLLSTRFDPLLWGIVGRHLPTVFTIHNIRGHEEREGRDGVPWRCFRSADAVVVHTSAGLAEVQRRLDGSVRAEVIHHGDYGFFLREHDGDRLASRQRLGLPLEAKLVLAFGAIRPYKGVADLIAAFPMILSRHPDACLVIAGPLLVGTEAEYRRAIAKAGVAQAVCFRPDYVPLDSVADYFRAADVAVFNYRDVTDSGALRIACSCGTPVVATAVGGFQEFLTDGVTGRLVPPSDRERLAGAVSDMMADRAEAEKMARAALQLSRAQWSWADSARATLALYRSLRRTSRT